MCVLKVYDAVDSKVVWILTIYQSNLHLYMLKMNYGKSCKNVITFSARK